MDACGGWADHHIIIGRFPRRIEIWVRVRHRPNATRRPRPNLATHREERSGGCDERALAYPIQRVAAEKKKSLLSRWKAGDSDAAERLFPLVYQELKSIATETTSITSLSWSCGTGEEALQ